MYLFLCVCGVCVFASFSLSLCVYVWCPSLLVSAADEERDEERGEAIVAFGILAARPLKDLNNKASYLLCVQMWSEVYRSVSGPDFSVRGCWRSF